MKARLHQTMTSIASILLTFRLPMTIVCSDHQQRPARRESYRVIYMYVCRHIPNTVMMRDADLMRLRLLDVTVWRVVTL